jgi:tRNA 2-thiouridine synthesizing protein D
MKILTIQIRTGTMMNMDTNVAMKLAAAAMDKGYGVRIFGYGEGVWLIKQGQVPKRFPNVGNEASALAEKGMEANDLTKFVAESDRMVTIAR